MKALAPPIPPQGRDIYGLRGVGVGESRFIACRKGQQALSLVAAIRMHGKRHQKKFVTRILVEEGKRGVRLWRQA